LGGEVSNDGFSRLFNLSINENVSVKDVVSSGLEDGGQSWRRISLPYNYCIYMVLLCANRA